MRSLIAWSLRALADRICPPQAEPVVVVFDFADYCRVFKTVIEREVARVARLN